MALKAFVDPGERGGYTSNSLRFHAGAVGKVFFTRGRSSDGFGWHQGILVGCMGDSGCWDDVIAFVGKGQMGSLPIRETNIDEGRHCQL